MVDAAPGSDLWPTTWADDDNIYTAWGDGGGFGGTNADGRVFFGVARVEGPGSSWLGVNVWGGKSPESTQAPTEGKSNGGIVAVDDLLYVYVQEQGVWTRSKLWMSADRGLTWGDLGWVLDEPDSAFASPGIIQFGPGYSGVPAHLGDYVFGYGHQGFNNGLGLFRVPRATLADRSSYEFFAGLDANGDPVWTADIAQKQPVFADSNGIGWGVNAVYHPVLDRYLMTVRHDGTGGWGIFDAPKPWGPWTTVAYYDEWIDPIFKFTFVFPQKWISSDGLTMWMVFSGVDPYDSINVIRADLTLRVQDETPPSAPTSLVATPASESQIDLTWAAASDDESGVASYSIYRDGVEVGNVTATAFTDSGLAESTGYNYEISAVNGAGLEGPKSLAVTATTLADTTPPTIASVTAAGLTQIIVVFSELVDGATAIDIANYAIDNSVSVLSASLSPDLKTVTLTSSSLVSGVTYTLTVNDVTDRATTANAIAPDSQVSFAFNDSLVVSDLTVASGASYEVVDQGLIIGADVYIDRGYTFTSVPEAVSGATYIKTANEDKARTEESFASFTVSSDVTVYVGYDVRATSLPDWLAGWTDSEAILDTTDVGLQLYYSDFPAGTISLGGNLAATASGAETNYTVVIAVQGGPFPEPPFPTLPGMSSAAQDLDGDGTAEDCNGNGYLDFADVVALFEHIDSPEVQGTPAYFDFNGNGGADSADVTALFNMIIS